MAKLGRWLSAYLGVFLLISCGIGFQLSRAEENYYEHDGDSESSFYYSDIVMLTDHKRAALRTKRYLAGEFDNLDMGKTSMAVMSNQDSFQDSGGKISDESNGTAASNNVTNGTFEPDATRIPSLAVNENEPKTGGNYLSVQNTSAEATIKNTTVNETVQPNSLNITVSNSSLVPDTISNNNVSVSLKNSSNILNNTSSTPNTTEKMNSSVTADQIAIFPDENVLTEHDIKNALVDTHVYYNSTFTNDEKLGKRLWVNMDNNPLVQTNDMLSQSHRRAATVKLSFDFPFYGHTVRNVTIATGGFLYTGDYVHSWLAATQYIAPLMANFDTSLSNESFIKYMDNGTQFTVQWDKVKLQDRPVSGAFTFQATLRNTGDIIFVYQYVPVVISNITDEHHPVKVGLSDAYIIDRHVLFVRRKTIYEYHRITFEHLSISNWTVINLTPLPTCVEATSCETCVSRYMGFDCSWCSKTEKCSSGIDRNRQEWLMNDCDRYNISTASLCPAGKKVTEIERSSTALPSTPELSLQTEQTVTALLADESHSVSASALLGILFCIGALLSLSFWALYAYRNPHTTSGQFLIKYRPSQWSWKRGEARYTAATIHM